MTPLTLLAAVPLRAWPALLLLVGLLAGQLALRAHWISFGSERVQAQWDGAKAKALAEHAAELGRVREKERSEAERYAAIAGELVERNQHANREIERLRADLAAGTVRLRQRFTCPSRLPDATAAASGSDAAGERGLRDSDVEFLVREAERADTAARRLTACQTLLRSSP